MTRSSQPRRILSRASFAAVALCGTATLLPASAFAQRVGYPPEDSPYRDVPFRQELTGAVGWFAPQSDPAGVAPRGGAMLSARYELRIGGPAGLYARLGAVSSERTVLDPSLPEGQRESERSTTLMLADVGIAVNLTGQKSWNNLIPVISTGVGVASDFRSADEGGYRFGTPFAIALGGGVRWVPGGNFSLRVDVTDHLYQIRYPNAYFQSPASGVPPILPATQSQSVWRHNAALTVGASWLFSR